nr:MAG TPA: hypothetical protein [Caudoviricetes sp.]
MKKFLGDKLGTRRYTDMTYLQYIVFLFHVNGTNV